jgi:hypothetical protein
MLGENKRTHETAVAGSNTKSSASAHSPWSVEPIDSKGIE